MIGAVVVMAIAAAGGDVRAQQSDPSEAELQAVYDEFCDHPAPCRVINGLADPSQSDVGAPMPPPLYESLQAHGRPASECPEAAEFYGADGTPVDAFLGPCPEVSGSGPGSGG